MTAARLALASVLPVDLSSDQCIERIHQRADAYWHDSLQPGFAETRLYRDIAAALWKLEAELKDWQAQIRALANGA